MSSRPIFSPVDSLQRLGSDGLLGIGVPVHQGGAGGSFVDVLDIVALTAQKDVRTAFMLASQRLLIEAFLNAQNVALREHHLPSLLAGEVGGGCAASWTLDTTVSPLEAIDMGSGWRMHGRLRPLPNLDTGSFLLSVPVSFDQGRTYSLVMLGSEEDGLRLHAAGEGNLALELTNVFLREDEILFEDGVSAVMHLSEVSSALQAAIAMGSSWTATPTTLEQFELDRFADSYAAMRAGVQQGRPLSACMNGLRKSRLTSPDDRRRSDALTSTEYSA